MIKEYYQFEGQRCHKAHDKGLFAQIVMGRIDDNITHPNVLLEYLTIHIVHMRPNIAS